MSESEQQGGERKGNYALEQLKRLRATRGAGTPAQIDRSKRGKEMQNLILKAIADEAKTVPEIAAETGLPEQDVFWWITALRKYNRVQDEKKRGDFVPYRKK